MKQFLLGFCLVVAATLGAPTILYARDIPPAPSLDRPIVDQTGTLSQDQITKLSELITNSRKEKDYQVGVLMINNLGVEAIEDYSIKVARAWGIGEKDKNNGILLLIAKDDRQLRIEVGSGLEGDLTDIQSSHVIRDVITPKFKENNFYAGIHDGLESIAALVQGKADPHPAPVASGWEILWSVLAGAGYFIIFGLVWLGSILARSKSWWGGGVVGGAIGGAGLLLTNLSTFMMVAFVPLVLLGLLFDYFVSKNYYKHSAAGDSAAWWAGGNWGSGGGSSGGGSFGGGGFSGGGSSGDW